MDTTGAGDSFLGCINHFIAKNPTGPFDEKYVYEAAQYGVIASGIVVTRIGSMCEMPTRSEVEAYMKKQLIS